MLTPIPLLIDIAAYVGLSTIILLGIVLYNPRLMLQDYPPAIKEIVPPKTDKEKKLTLCLGLPFLLVLLVYPILATVFAAHKNGGLNSFFSLWLYGFLVTFSFNLWDWLVLDWLLFCTITPKFFIIPGSECHAAYKDYGFHFRGFLIGSLFSCALGVVAASVGLISLYL